MLSVWTMLKLVGLIALNTFTFSALGYLLALFIRSDSAWSGMLTIIGTLVGFVGGIYIPLGTLNSHVRDVLACLPVLHGASMMRKVCTNDAVLETFAGLPDAAGEIFREELGVSISLGGTDISNGISVLVLLGYAVLAILTAALCNRKRRMGDR